MNKQLISRFGLTAVASMAVVSSVFAQATPPTTTPVPADQPTVAPATQPTTTSVKKDAEYRISREDRLVITCLNSQDFSTSVTVLPDGTISYPKMGQIKVAGKTLKQVETEIIKFLKKTEFLRPQVTVAVLERQVRQVSVTGSGIRQGGKHVMRDGWRVLDALSDAGGLMSDRTDLFTAKLIRSETGETLPVDLDALYTNSNSDANMALEPNDVVIVDMVDDSKSQVWVTGEVIKPGPVLISRDKSVTKALEAAGGAKPSAQLTAVVIERNGQKIPVDLLQYSKDGTEPTVKLEPGDKLVVPENKRLVYMVGAFQRQGATLIPDDRPLTVIQAISDAGVPLQNAETKKTQIIRQGPDGKMTATVLNVEEMMNKADYSKDIVLKPGDLVYVPFKGGRKFGFGDIGNNLGAILNMRYLMESFRR